MASSSDNVIFGVVRRHRFVRAGGTHVGELFAFERVHFEIVFTAVLANDHACVDVRLRADHHLAALLEVPQGKGDGGAVFHRDQNASAAARDRRPCAVPRSWKTRLMTPVPRVSVRNSP